MNPVIYYREGRDVPEDEIAAMKASFRCVQSRMLIRPTPDSEPVDLVIARYSAHPAYKVLEFDVGCIGAKLINTYRQHRWIADLGNWVETLEGLTPQTWGRLEDVPESAFPLVVKGETYSKKFLWDSHMFAETRRDAVEVMCHLQDDGLISGEHIYFRKYVPLKRYLTGFRGMPVAKEFRLFIYNGQVLSRGFYWSNYWDDLPEKPDPNEIPEAFLREVISRVEDRLGKAFWVVDVAQTEDGSWLVVELNDGQMSGLSMNDPYVLYPALLNAVMLGG